MPRFNGPIAYPIEVFAHLLWCYLLFGLTFLLLPLPLVIVAALNAGALQTLQSFALLFVGAPVFFLGCIHTLVFLSFWYAVTPRFPYAPIWLTVVIAAIFGSACASLVWAGEKYGFTAASVVAERPWTVGLPFAGMLALSIVASLFGFVLHRLGAVAPGISFPKFTWFGRLLVGREPYDAFVASEEAQLRSEYEQYRQDIGRAAK